MIEIYVKLILAGKKAIEDVPVELQEKVKLRLSEINA